MYQTFWQLLSTRRWPTDTRPYLVLYAPALKAVKARTRRAKPKPKPKAGRRKTARKAARKMTSGPLEQ
jgi:hypothetical protein